MELVTLFSTAFIVGFSGAMMPGPLLTATISETARRGFIAGPLVVFGHFLLEMALVIGLAAGLSRYLAHNTFTGVIGLVGGIILIWMGWGIVKETRSPGFSLSIEAGGEESPGMGPIVAGIITSLSNPYWSLWWATIGASYLVLAMQKGKCGIISFFTGHILADFVWYSLIALAIVTGRKFLNDRVYKGILAVCGLFLLALGLYFLYTGITFLS